MPTTPARKQPHAVKPARVCIARPGLLLVRLPALRGKVERVASLPWRARQTLLTPAFLNPRLRSLPRGNVLVLSCLALALPLSHFPHLQANYWLALPILGIAVGTFDTMRCMRKRWDFYHGGVILCLYMDLMVMILVLFLLLYPALL